MGTLLAAWSGYQSALWNGIQADDYVRGSGTRVEATKAATLAGQERIYDSQVFSQWLNAYDAGNTHLATIYEHRFREELRVAHRAWLATDPFTNPDAPPGPMFMPEYVQANAQSADALEEAAQDLVEVGEAANDVSDRYVLYTVVFATVLFLAAVSDRFRWRKARLARPRHRCRAGRLRGDRPGPPARRLARRRAGHARRRGGHPESRREQRHPDLVDAAPRVEAQPAEGDDREVGDPCPGCSGAAGARIHHRDDRAPARGADPRSRRGPAARRGSGHRASRRARSRRSRASRRTRLPGRSRSAHGAAGPTAGRLASRRARHGSEGRPVARSGSGRVRPTGSGRVSGTGPATEWVPAPAQRARARPGSTHGPSWAVAGVSTSSARVSVGTAGSRTRAAMLA